MNFIKLRFLLFLMFGFLFCFSCSQDDFRDAKPIFNFETTTGVKNIDVAKEYDVVVYGGTASGILAAAEVAKSGKTVLLIKPLNTALGGMTTNGLGITDVVNTNILGGLTRDFYKSIKEYYSNGQNWFFGNNGNYARYSYDGEVMIWFEPKAAKYVLRDFIVNNAVPVLHSERLDLNDGVKKNAQNAIVSIKMESGLVIKGKMFIDATYEGDLMAKSGVSYTYGRESNSQYNEINNGVQRVPHHDRNQLPDGIKKHSFTGHLSLPGNGTGDKKIQAYCYRMCLTNVRDNRIAIEKPIDYNEDDYSLLYDYLKTYDGNTFFDLMPLPNGKTDSNNFGPVSTDYVGKNYNYPEGNYEERESIIANHKRYQIGLLWTLANSPNVPERIRSFYREWGLAKDEFVESNNWPNQLYIREGRRMIGEYVMTERNCSGQIKAERGVSLGDYPMDSHIVQRYIDNNGNVKNEGQLMARTPRPYPIDYRSIVPKRTECTNLFVPVCLSATHIAFGSIRMEPVYMSLGQASAVAAVLALNKGTTVQNLPYESLRNELLDKKLILQ
ncbi:FAD-dependent oxidoreductase [Flavobacterium poyangense]|uniref:FAD-dependent oxidoreductase n=1 Tax=Flavobacterium poyangense TaxID=2204302 RepID=UPI001AB02398|nr:FAD-dependent oxidoreductase [Flavobacterium sp. JXAS1]